MIEVAGGILLAILLLAALPCALALAVWLARLALLGIALYALLTAPWLWWLAAAGGMVLWLGWRWRQR